jgi:hypothetical protein
MSEEQLMKTGHRLASCPARPVEDFTSAMTRDERRGPDALARRRMAWHKSPERISRWEKSTGLKVARDSYGNVLFDQMGARVGFYLDEGTVRVQNALLDERNSLIRIRTGDDNLFDNFFAFKEAVIDRIKRYNEEEGGTLKVEIRAAGAPLAIPNSQLREHYNSEGTMQLHFRGEGQHGAAKPYELLEYITQDPRVRDAAAAMARAGAGAGVLSLGELYTLELSHIINPRAYDVGSALSELGF